MMEKLISQEKENRPDIVMRKLDSTVKEEIVALIQEKETVDMWELQEEIDTDSNNLEHHINELIDEGIVAEIKPCRFSFNPFYETQLT